MILEKALLNLPDFTYTNGSFGGVNSILINPNDISVKWDTHLLNLRSSIWDSTTYELLSAGHKKFFNYGESPNLYPQPEKYTDWVIEEKIDGSLMIVDYVNGSLSCRTRGTFSHNSLGNREDFEFCLAKYPNIEKVVKNNKNYSFLFEITSPNQIIVLRYGQEPNVIFLSAIDKSDYSYIPREQGKLLAKEMGVSLVEEHSFSTINDILLYCKNVKGKEGFVLSYNSYQNRVKIKTPHYLAIHKIKSKLNSFESIVDLWISLKKPKYKEFIDLLTLNYDWELASTLQSDISIICDSYKTVLKIIEHMKQFCENLKGKSRKEAAFAIIAAYGKTNRSSMVFSILDGKELDDDSIKKLIFQVLRK